MRHHTVKSYDKDLHHLDELIAKAGKLVLEMFVLHKNALHKYTPELTKQIHSIDLKVNNTDKEIGDHAMVMLATRQPVAIDLRHVISSLKMSVIIERMGDISKHIVDRSERQSVSIPDDILKDVDRMNDMVSQMLLRALHAYKILDTNEAFEVIKLDLEVDKVYSNIMEGVSKTKSSLSEDVSSLMQFTICLKNIERLGDYIKKLANITHYIATGEKLGN